MIHQSTQRGFFNVEGMELETRLPQPAQLPTLDTLKARANEVKQLVLRRNQARRVNEAAAALLSR